MNDQAAAGDAVLRARLEDLEMRYMHAQRTIEQLNEVVVEHAKLLDMLQRRLTAVGTRLDVLATRDVEPRTLEDDKPPHY